MTARSGWRSATMLAAAVLVALATGCAQPGRTLPGALRADVVAKLGQPTATYPLPSGERLQYSLQPLGHEVHNIDLDAQGRVVAVQQTLEPGYFDRIRTDVWTTRDVLLAFGKPALIEKVSRFDGEVWTYRFLDFYTPWFLHLYIDRGGVVRTVQRFEEFPVRGADSSSFP
jgi:hypothetical protein